MNEQLYISKLKPKSLSSILYHKDIEGLERFSSEGDFPLHLAIHDIDLQEINQLEYVQAHKHDTAEINIFWGDSDLKLELTVNDISYIVGDKDAVWIPKDHLHSIRAISGKGMFICLVLNSEYTAKK